MLSWAFGRLSRAFSDHRESGFPLSSLLRFLRPPSKREAARRSRDLPDDRIGGRLATPPTLMRFVTRTHPRLLPKAMRSCRLPDWK